MLRLLLCLLVLHLSGPCAIAGVSGDSAAEPSRDHQIEAVFQKLAEHATKEDPCRKLQREPHPEYNTKDHWRHGAPRTEPPGGPEHQYVGHESIADDIVSRTEERQKGLKQGKPAAHFPLVVMALGPDGAGRKHFARTLARVMGRGTFVHVNLNDYAKATPSPPLSLDQPLAFRYP